MIGESELRRMQAIVSLAWGPAQRWTPGEVAWAVRTEPGGHEVSFVDDGFVWRQEDYLVVVGVVDPSALDRAVLGATGAVQVHDHDGALLAALARAGFVEDGDAPFELDLRLRASSAGPPRVAPGYRVRSAVEGDDLVGVHGASWRPADLPFAPGHDPPVDPAATSSFDAERLRDVQASAPYDLDLHVVAEAPDGSLAGSCIAWLDPATKVASIEPLGIVAGHRRRGLAGALCLEVARLVAARGGTEVVIHPRGDAAYPAARGAYLRVGFEPVGRTMVFRRA
ncbi:MAG: GNAT family N-acetyltransferase [Acidimicrobiia bacterium]